MSTDPERRGPRHAHRRPPPAPVPPLGFLRSRSWQLHATRGVVLAAASALTALAFVGAVDVGTELLWPEVGPEAFSGSIRILGVLTAAGVLVGLVHRMVSGTREVDVFAGLVQGRIDPSAVPGGILVALVSLVGGASLGPEVPTGMLGGGMATAVADVRGWDDEACRSGVRSAVASAWGGLFTSPYVSTLMAFELSHAQNPAAWPLLLVEIAAAVVGFAVFYLAGGFAEVLRSLDLAAYDFRAVDLLYATAVGVVASVGGVLFAMSVRWFRLLAARFGDRPVLKATVAGAGLGLLGMALPLTLFNGAEGLVTVTSEPASLGVSLIVVSAAAKLAATSGALAFGFIGGPIFPAMFAGGSLGAAVSELFPTVPPVVAIAGGIAALPACIVDVPFSVAVLAMLIVGTTPTAAPAVLTAAAVAFLLVRGLGLLAPPAARNVPPPAGWARGPGRC